jgi:pimeloyl-ACP methyl ester carboxylesterase
VIVLHGLGESKASFPYFGVAGLLAKKGYRAVLIDLRDHGHSGGEYVTYGALESKDVRAVVDALLGEGLITEPIYAFGNTLGASTAIQYAAGDPRCRGVVAIAPYKDFRSVGWRVVTFRNAMMSPQEYDRIVAEAGRMAGFDPDEASAVKAAARLHCPLLVIHGMLDLSVPTEDSEAVYEAATGAKKLEKLSVNQFLLPAVMEDWIVARIDAVAHGRLTPASEPASSSAPASEPQTAP